MSNFSSKQGWRIIGDRRIYFRSRWEANYGFYLEFLKKQRIISEWEHEPKTFWFLEIKRGVRSYLPDFRVTSMNGVQHWVEVKGFYDARSKTKIKRFKKYYPEEVLFLIDSVWFRKNAPNMKSIVPGWESDNIKLKLVPKRRKVVKEYM